MHETQTTTVYTDPGYKRYAILGAVVIALLIASNGYLFWQLKNVRQQVGDLTTNFATEMSTVRETSALDSGKTQKQLEDLRAELAATMEKASTSVGQARSEAKKHAENLAKQLAQKQDEQRTEIAEKISEIEEQSTTKFEQVTTDVGAVRTEVATTRQDLEHVVSDFKQVRGDMGVMSGRIATTGEELAALKALGDRNYFEFDVTKSKTPTRVGEIQVVLRNTESKNNRFAIDIFADDKRIEKKYKTVNEPIQFYIGGRGGQPYEIVVNEVGKNRIVGYLAAPKVERAGR